MLERWMEIVEKYNLTEVTVKEVDIANLLKYCKEDSIAGMTNTANKILSKIH